MIVKTEYEKIKPYTTKDGSVIRELMHPDVHGNFRQSLAEAVVPAGSSTLLHKHMQSEEMYHILQGTGLMVLEDREFRVKPGDTVYIPQGAAHNIRNQGKEPLKILCCSSPPYSHADTLLL